MPAPAKPPLNVWWTVWFTLQVGLFPIYFFLAGDARSAAASGAGLPWPVGFGPLVASIVIRWGILPRVTDGAKAWPIFMMGIAVAQGTCFFGIYLVPSHQQLLFLLSVLGVGQFVPFFARRFYEDAGTGK